MYPEHALCGGGVLNGQTLTLGWTMVCCHQNCAFARSLKQGCLPQLCRDAFGSSDAPQCPPCTYICSQTRFLLCSFRTFKRDGVAERCCDRLPDCSYCVRRNAVKGNLSRPPLYANATPTDSRRSRMANQKCAKWHRDPAKRPTTRTRMVCR